MCNAVAWLTAHYELLKDFSGPVATGIAAVAAVFVTWRLGRGQLRIAQQQADVALQQTHLAEVRLQHDLFERRIAVFDAARDLLLEAFKASGISDEVWNAFIQGTQKSVFLFDQTVTNYITEMRNRGSSLRAAVEKLREETLPSPERMAFAQIREDNSQWFIKQFDVLIVKFRPALALEKDVATRLPRPT